MWLLAVTFLALVSNISAKYGLYFTGDSSLKYDYAEPVDMANNKIKIDFTIPQAFSESLDVSGLPIALLNISSVQLDSLTIEIHPGNYIFITVLAPDSAQDPQAMGYCMYGSPLPSDEVLSLEVNRTGNVIEMSVNGEVGNVQCIPIAVEPTTGEINQVQYVTIGYSTDTFQLTSFVGCIHSAIIDGIDLLADTCAKATPGKSTSNTFTFESDACPAVAPTTNVVCPTTATPTDPPTPTKPTTAGATTEPIITTPVVEPTLPKVETNPATKPATTKPATDSGEPEIPVTDEPPAIVDPVVPTEINNIVDPTDDYEVVDPDNQTGTDEAILEKSTSDDDDNSLIIIICVVVGGVIVVVILLTVGYKFHFRDKGSYKLEESKNFDNDGFNEYTDLNAAEKKNEEWYL